MLINLVFPETNLLMVIDYLFAFTMLLGCFILSFTKAFVGTSHDNACYFSPLDD